MTAMMDWGTPKGVRRDYLDGRFGQVHYRIARPDNPTAVPLACFHPSPSSGWLYGRLLAEMGRDRIAVAPDTPGFGESDAPQKAPEIEDYAAAMGEVLDSLGFVSTAEQNRSKGRRKTGPFSVMRYAVLRVVPLVHRRAPRCFA